MKLLFALLLLFSLKGYAQYPFEKYPSVKFKKAAIDGSLTTDPCGRIVVFKSYTIRFLCTREPDSSNIILYHHNKVIKKIKAPFDFSPVMVFDPLYIGDIDGNGLADFKIQLLSDGAGLAGALRHKIYLFNKGHNKFNAIYFCDFSVNIERDFNSDKNFEILSQTYIIYKSHSYWLFDLYNYKNGKLINVSKKYGYPIAVPYLFNETYKVTHKIPKKDLVRLSLKVPKFYSIN